MKSARENNGRSSQNRDGLRVKKVSDITRAISMCVYGRSGSGKTTFAATAPGPILYVDIRDEGTASISDVKGLDVFEVEAFADIEEIYWWLHKNPKKYKTVILDTVSQLQGMIVQEVAGNNKKGKRAGDWGSMTKKDWGDVAAVMKEWLGNYRDLTAKGINVIFIAQDRTFNLSDEEEANDSLLAPEIGPALSPAVAKSLNASVSVLANTFIREITKVKEINGKKIKKGVIQYCLGVGPSPIYTRKLRKPKRVTAPDAIVDPSWEDVVEIMKGNVE